MDKQAAYRSLPAVHKVLAKTWASDLIERHSHVAVSEAIAEILDDLRSTLNRALEEEGKIDESWWLEHVSDTSLHRATESLLSTRQQPVLKEVLNLTGVVVHTNLGRAPLSERALAAVMNIAAGYSNLEYNLDEGKRGSRHDLVEKRLCELTGAEAAMVVNNNAAAVYLVLRELAQGGQAIVSRGELVEIGGSFRIPAIMAESGVDLVEVGTTNKTHLSDYESAVTDDTKLLLRVHTSNFKIIGFTERPPLQDLRHVANHHRVWLYEDLGSGALIDFKAHGIGDEMTVKESLDAGVDVVSFSGDKLLGGAQAGIIVGRKEIIQRLKRNQLARVLRVDKMTLAALEATLIDSADEVRARQTIPVVRMLTEPIEMVWVRAETAALGIKEALEELLSSESETGSPTGGEPQQTQAEDTVQKHDEAADRREFSASKFSLHLVEESGRIGGGALPEEALPSVAIELRLSGISAQQLFVALRTQGIPPVIGHVVDDCVRLNVKTLLPGEEEAFILSVVSVCRQLITNSISATSGETGE